MYLAPNAVIRQDLDDLLAGVDAFRKSASAVDLFGELRNFAFSHRAVNEVGDSGFHLVATENAVEVGGVEVESHVVSHIIHPPKNDALGFYDKKRNYSN